MTKTKLTPLQSETVNPRPDEILQHITEFYEQYGYPVTQVWVAKKIGISKSSMTPYIKELLDANLILKTLAGQVYPNLKNEGVDNSIA